MQTEKIQNLIEELMVKTGIPTVNILISKENESTWFAVELSEPHYFLAREGEGLYALNHLARKIVEGKFGADPDLEVEPPSGGSTSLKSPEFTIDINGFQKKRIENVRAIAHMMAERARYFKSNIEVDPMSAFERRVVHEFLAGETDLKTESTGYGPTRRVVIKYLGDSL